MNSPKISVIVPIYKAEKYIEKCLRSLFGQTLDGIEYIFVDDCSPDNSTSIIKRLLEEYPTRKSQVKIIQHKTNQGVSKSRQDGLDEATGEYIIHCDPDDWVELEAYERMYNEAREKDADVVLCDFNKVKITKSSYDLTTIIQKPFMLTSSSMIESFSGLSNNVLHGSTCNKLIKRECAKKAYFPTDISYCEDIFYCFQIFSHELKIEYIPSPLYYYRSNPNSIVNTISIDSLYKDLNLIRYIYNLMATTEDSKYKKACGSLIIGIITYRFLYSNYFSNQDFKVLFSKYKPFIYLNRRINLLTKFFLWMSLSGFHKSIYNIHSIFSKTKNISSYYLNYYFRRTSKIE